MKRLYLSLLIAAVVSATALLSRQKIFATQTKAEEVSPDLISQVAVERPARQANRILEFREEKIRIDRNEIINIRVQLSTKSRPIDLVAPHGGGLNGKNSHLHLQTDENGNASFTFQSGKTRGSYTVEISDGRSTEALVIRVGGEPPLGKPGPNLVFK